MHHHYHHVDWTGILTIITTLLVGLGTIFFIWRQALLIKRQIQFQTYLELEKEWNNEYLPNRERLVKLQEKPMPYQLEAVLEFLEKFALFKRRNAMDADFILSSSIGFYAVRYFYYFKEDIYSLRELYKDSHLYEELESFYKDYLKWDGHVSKQQIKQFEISLDQTKNIFMKNESLN